MYGAWHVISAAGIFVEHMENCGMELGASSLERCFSVKLRAIAFGVIIVTTSQSCAD